MLKKSLLEVAAALGCVALSSFLLVRFAGPPRTPLALLGALSVVAITAVAAFLLVAAPAHRTDGAGTGVLAMLILVFGASVILMTLAASAFGMGPALLYVGAALIALPLTAAVIAARKRDR